MKWLYLIPVVIFVALSILFATMLDRDTRLVPSPLIGKSAPEFHLNTLLNPNSFVSPASLLGKPWVLNVWASWCAACRQEHDVFNKLSRAYPSITLVGLNYKDTHQDAQKWLAKLGNPYDLIAVDNQGSVGLEWGVYGVPETFLIDENGVIQYKHVGPVDQAVVEDVIVPFFNGETS